MAFFVGMEKDRPDPECVAWAKKFREILSHKHRMTAAWNSRAWAEEFSWLKKTHGSERVDRALAWYLANAGKEFVPRAFSARAFRIKFDAVETAMQNSDSEESECVDVESKELAARLLSEVTYPVEVAARLPSVIQRTKDAWAKLCGVMAKYLVMCPPSARERMFVHHILHNHAPVFVENWMLLIAKKYGRQKNFLGPAHCLSFKPTLETFKDHFWHDWSEAWSGDACVFDKLLDELNKGEGETP